MNTAELKNYLHQLVVETNDENILTKVKEYFTSLSRGNELDWWDKISETQKFEIEVGVTQLKNGQGISDPEVRNKVDVLLKRK